MRRCSRSETRQEAVGNSEKGLQLKSLFIFSIFFTDLQACNLHVVANTTAYSLLPAAYWLSVVHLVRRPGSQVFLKDKVDLVREDWLQIVLRTTCNIGLILGLL